ncbi:cupin [Streptomyces sp. NBC_01207]|uniref:cupin n=1 Tax=Streptomyces sp. NBC_01207 TaxID=2903772 RepID=UPI002E164FE5|nr:cupin [Streptomyces sp. NBC_01207]
MPSVGLRRRVEAIPGTPLPHGLLGGCATIVDVTDVHELMGTDWVPLSCAAAHDWDWCPDPAQDPPQPAEKISDRPGFCSAAPITIYARATCNPISWPHSEAVEHVTETLRMGEQRALEDWVMREVLCPLATDLTPAEGAVSVAAGVAALEGWLGETYGGVGVLHVPTGAAALLGCCNVVHMVDGSPQTLVGNCVIIGSGYSLNVGPPDCTAAPAGEAWLYASSPVRVRQEAPEVVPDTEAQSVRITTNDKDVIAERTFVVEIACCETAAIRVTLC